MSDPDLKPCPHCGPGESVVSLYYTDTGRYTVACGACGSHGGHCGSEDDARKLWNRRPAEGPASLELVRLTRELALVTRGRARMQDHWNEARAERDRYKGYSEGWYKSACDALDAKQKQAAEIAALRERAEQAERERDAARHHWRNFETSLAYISQPIGQRDMNRAYRTADERMATKLAEWQAARPAPEPTS